MTKSNPGVDRISNLPSNVIERILGFLPLCDAVGTSALSKKWRYKWVTIPQLVCDESFEESLNEDDDDLETIIDRILVLHRGPITKFSVKDTEIHNPASIDRWLLFLSSYHSDHMEDLEVTFLGKIPLHKMPTCVFDFDCLKHLYVASVDIKLPPSFGGFGRLLKLELMYVEMELDDLEILLSKCPMLEYLHLQIPVLNGSEKGGNIQPNHCLTVLKLDEIYFAMPDYVNFVFNLLRSSPNLQSLEISSEHSSHGNKHVAIDCLKDAPPIPLNHLKNAKISNMSGYTVEREFVRKLLQWATELKKLKLKSCLSDDDDSDDAGIEPDKSKIVTTLRNLPRSSSAAKVIFKGDWRK
ncbi:F-box/FBD/LRR-repeat protein At1g13570-like [Andrographis paniculata]|uniref:F-box/FBD/LRR-repeat protein At1g13570-like n=1 Tax=Andrographis paniculata TaxID=175694 RepID=UPI0021E8CEE8|nr:F-box/FBD/LRR-repeat protein At1g13570-like [Andrographis paniculata]XP_051149697.1 F-box/FBD/LRR-repeat protein At1g13570-like [Andrographis paniculata]XP_051149698.1 F-box/FBD/LRR-repeat protein At1g13570-like [Andrographis paniculata]